MVLIHYHGYHSRQSRWRLGEGDLFILVGTTADSVGEGDLYIILSTTLDRVGEGDLFIIIGAAGDRVGEDFGKNWWDSIHFWDMGIS